MVVLGFTVMELVLPMVEPLWLPVCHSKLTPLLAVVALADKVMPVPGQTVPFASDDAVTVGAAMGVWLPMSNPTGKPSRFPYKQPVRK